MNVYQGVKYMARRTRISALDNDSEMFRLLKSKEASEDNSKLRKIAIKALKKVIDEQLSARQKQYLVLYYYNNMDMPAIADECGVNKSTVSRTLNRAKQNIYKYMKYYFN